ncbi:DUF6292 family protein [Nonomuraea glycinis]|uniref:DUF6292 domain-containing protein n=1 Tax=Nonomuraea glycinis TaxID=2047744 RepID=A0A918E856_9ACTN|nr:DUF6292 family protein [Nonomuraea glycinis]MCA2180613.1 DUF6292 family protein [Nonomuraea glycinis]GGP12073.1 hypothetical protein GCM10012278_58370 [Nonomuraea glycinis]
MTIRHVEPYSDEWLQQPVCYVRLVVELLGAEVADWWEGPCDPREATVRLADGAALVWDEESGWRLGRFVSGGSGERTELTGSRYLGGGLLPRPERVPAALADARAGVGACSAWRPCYRSHRSCHDGFDVALDFYRRLIDA